MKAEDDGLSFFIGVQSQTPLLFRAELILRTVVTLTISTHRDATTPPHPAVQVAYNPEACSLQALYPIPSHT
jgi:hypothetical protein